MYPKLNGVFRQIAAIALSGIALLGITVGQPFTDVQTVYQSIFTSCMLSTQGVVRCWGDEFTRGYGANVPPTASPQEIPGLPSGMKQVVDVSSGRCALSTSGSVWCWGMIYESRPLGSVAPAPFLLSRFDGNVIELSTQYALLSDGSVVCFLELNCPSATWGGVPVAGLSSGVTRLFNGCAVQNEQLKCWGDNAHGVLGDGTTMARETAVPVVGVTAPVTKVLRVNDTRCAVHGIESRLSCWGSNVNGLIGTLDTQDQLFPVSPEPLTSGVSNFVLKYEQACAIKNEALYCWGVNGYAAANAFGLPSGRTIPTQATAIANARDLSHHYIGFLCVLSTPSVLCESSWTGWGAANGYTPAGLPATIDALLPGGCALSSGTAYCWSGPSGDGVVDFASYAREVEGGETWSALFAGHNSFCVNSPSATKCWGANDGYQLGDSTGFNRGTLGVIEQFPQGEMTQLSSTVVDNCAMRGLEAWCWGLGEWGGFGGGPRLTTPTPTRALGLDNFEKLDAGSVTRCGIRQSRAYCWGGGLTAGAGFGDIYRSDVPVLVPNLPSPVTALAMGMRHACAIANGEVYCWGDNYYRQLGSDVAASAEAIPVALAGNPIALYSGNYSTCAVFSVGVQCWGSNGVSTLGARLSPLLSPPRFVEGFYGQPEQLAMGDAFVCALQRGSVACTTRAPFATFRGELQFNPTVPVVQTIDGMHSGVTAIAATGATLCALRQGRVVCVGDNQYGQLGIGGGYFVPQARALAATTVEGLVNTPQTMRVPRGKPFWVDVSLMSKYAPRTAAEPIAIVASLTDSVTGSVSLANCTIAISSTSCRVEFTYQGSSNRLTLQSSTSLSTNIPASSNTELWVRDVPSAVLAYSTTPILRQTDPTEYNVTVLGPGGEESNTEGVVVVTIGDSVCEFAHPNTSCSVTPTQSGDLPTRVYFSGTDALDQSAAIGGQTSLQIASGCVVDLDGDGNPRGLTDGLLMLRALLGLSGAALVNGLSGATNLSSQATAIAQRVQRMKTSGLLDLDRDGSVDAATDGVILLRSLLGFRGAALVRDLLQSGSTRTDPSEIQQYIASQCMSTPAN